MQFSTKMRYGTRALVELALAHPGPPIPVREVARRQAISAKYLEQIMSQLRAAGIVKSVRGVHGGYTLARPPESCRLSEVFAVLEGSAAPVDCVDAPETCSFRDACPARETWAEVRNAIMGVLENTTLRDLVWRASAKRRAQARMYQI